MSKYILKIVFALMVLCFFSCQKDDEGFTPLPNGGSDTSYESEIVGFVFDENNEPIDEASVSFNGTTVQTDELGVYLFKDVLVNSRHNFINIEKEGFFKGTKVFRTRTESTLALRTQLLEKNFNHSFDTGTGATIQEENVTINFTGNSVVYEGTTNSYSGEVKLAVRYLDPTDEALFLNMPGDLSGIDNDNVMQTLTSFGMAYVEMESPSGEPLQLKESHPAEMSMLVEDDLLSNAPETIPLWHFDTTSGLWKNEGTADLQGNTYTGKVAHFSCWNYDSNLPAIVINGRLIDPAGNPLPYLHIKVSVEGVAGQGQGWSNPDGTFAGAVAKDELLTIIITSNYNCGTDVYNSEIGPFSQDTDIGDIVIDLSANPNFTHVTAQFVDCDLNPIEYGAVSVGGNFYVMLNSSIDVSFLTCDPSLNYSVIGYDLDNHFQSEAVALANIPGTNNLGTIAVCDLESYYIEINSEDPLSNITCTLELIADESDSGFNRLFGYSNEELRYIQLEYDDGVTGDFVLGTFNLSLGVIQEDELEQGYLLESGTVTITHYVQGVEDYVKGNYSITTTHSVNAGTFVFEGEFKLRVFL